MGGSRLRSNSSSLPRTIGSMASMSIRCRMMGWSDPKMSPLTIWLSSEYDSWPADPVKHTFSGGFCTAKRGRGGGVSRAVQESCVFGSCRPDEWYLTSKTHRGRQRLHKRRLDGNHIDSTGLVWVENRMQDAIRGGVRWDGGQQEGERTKQTCSISSWEISIDNLYHSSI